MTVPVELSGVIPAGEDSARLTVDTDEEIVKIGQKGHLIVTGLAGKRNFPAGMASAIPFEIVE